MAAQTIKGGGGGTCRTQRGMNEGTSLAKWRRIVHIGIVSVANLVVLL